jgi:hypothetical protein
MEFGDGAALFAGCVVGVVVFTAIIIVALVRRARRANGSTSTPRPDGYHAHASASSAWQTDAEREKLRKETVRLEAWDRRRRMKRRTQ